MTEDYSEYFYTHPFLRLSSPNELVPPIDDDDRALRQRGDGKEEESDIGDGGDYEGVEGGGGVVMMVVVVV